MTDADTDPASEEPAVDSVAEMRAALAEAEAAEAEALAEAERARALAGGDPEDLDEDDVPAGIDADLDAGLADEAHSAAVPGGRLIALAGALVGALLTGAAVTLIALMLWQHAKLGAERIEEQRFVEAARDGVVALLSIDHTHARDDVQRVLDLSTGQFRDDFARSADDFVKTAESSKAVTKGTINAAALDSRDGDTARVLVSATSEVSNVNGAQQDPRPFRMSVTVTREGDTCKMSDVEFVP